VKQIPSDHEKHSLHTVLTFGCSIGRDGIETGKKRETPLAGIKAQDRKEQRVFPIPNPTVSTGGTVGSKNFTIQPIHARKQKPSTPRSCRVEQLKSPTTRLLYAMLILDIMTRDHKPVPERKNSFVQCRSKASKNDKVEDFIHGFEVGIFAPVGVLRQYNSQENVFFIVQIFRCLIHLRSVRFGLR